MLQSDRGHQDRTSENRNARGELIKRQQREGEKEGRQADYDVLCMPVVGQLECVDVNERGWRKKARQVVERVVDERLRNVNEVIRMGWRD